MADMGNVLQNIVGTDENGEARALSCLMVEKRIKGDGAGPVVQDLAYIRDACVSVSFTKDFVVVDLTFEDQLDYEYLRAGELCRKYSDMADVSCLAGHTGGELSLVLCLVAKGEYEVFLTGVDAAWCLMPREPEGGVQGYTVVFYAG